MVRISDRAKSKVMQSGHGSKEGQHQASKKCLDKLVWIEKDMTSKWLGTQIYVLKANKVERVIQSTQ